ncbi:MAG TPA: exosortase, partial [Nitrospiraceae bacterium]
MTYSSSTAHPIRPVETWTFLSSPHVFWGVTLAMVGLLGYVFHDSLAYMVHQWIIDDNYGHGFFVPFISAYLIWHCRRHVSVLPSDGHSWGIVCILVGGLFYVLGDLGTVYSLLHLSLWMLGCGLVISAVGLAPVRQLWFPIVYLLTMIPLPQFLYQGLSSRLQLLSSAIGVGCLQVIGVTAYRDGNIIDLGPIQLQVIEACSGLRYLFPLMSLALVCAYFFHARLWKRVFLVLSSIPISIGLNGFRIAMVGLLVDLYGAGAAEGFLHLFEGWVLFLISIGILWLEMVVLSWMDRPAASSTASIWWPIMRHPSTEHHEPCTSAKTSFSYATYLLASGLILIIVLGASRIVHRDEHIPSRLTFVDFPMRITSWSGTPFS